MKSTSAEESSLTISALPSRPIPFLICRKFYAAWSSPSVFTRYGTVGRLFGCWENEMLQYLNILPF